MTRMHLLGVSAAVCALVLAGCPSGPPDYAPAIIVQPTAIEIGPAADAAYFTVSNVYTSRPLPPFTITSSTAWASADPDTGTSTGPDDPVLITASVDRSKLTSVVGQAILTISAEGLVPRTVTVVARSYIAANFTVSTTAATVGQLIQFTDKSAVAQGQAAIQTRTWDFGDSSALSHETNPVHYYNAPGTYSITLTVSNGVHTATVVRQNYITVKTAGS